MAIVIDVETNSLYGEVIEIAWMPVGAAECAATTRFKPSSPMDPRAAAVHGIDPMSLKNCRPSSEAIRSLPDDNCWIGHNVLYDWERLGRPSRVRLLCTLRLSELLWPSINSYRLDALYLELFGISKATLSKTSGAHGAASDVWMCNAVFSRIVSESGVVSLDQLPSLSHPDTWKSNG